MNPRDTLYRATAAGTLSHMARDSSASFLFCPILPRPRVPRSLPSPGDAARRRTKRRGTLLHRYMRTLALTPALGSPAFHRARGFRTIYLVSSAGAASRVYTRVSSLGVTSREERGSGCRVPCTLRQRRNAVLIIYVATDVTVSRAPARNRDLIERYVLTKEQDSVWPALRDRRPLRDDVRTSFELSLPRAPGFRARIVKSSPKRAGPRKRAFD